MKTDAFITARNLLLSVIREKESDLSEFKEMQNKRHEEGKLTDSKIEWVRKEIKKREKWIESLKESLDLLETTNSQKMKQIRRLEAENEAIVSQVPILETIDKQALKEQKKRKREALKALEQAENRTIQLILNPQLQIEIYGHLRLIPDDYERYLEDVYQCQYPALNSSFLPYYAEAIQNMTTKTLL